MFNNMFLYIERHTKVGHHEFSQNQKNVTDSFPDLWASEKLLSMGFEILGLGDFGD